MQVMTEASAGAARSPAAPTRPLVSVVLPVFNEARTLPELMRRLDEVTRALESRYHFEFVFVDDGSTDGTVEAIERVARDDSRIALVSLRRNYGQTAALQVGFEHARG